MKWVVMVYRTKRQRKPDSYVFPTKKDANVFQKGALKMGAVAASEPFKYKPEEWSK